MMKKKGALGIQEMIYFILGLLVLMLGYMAFNYSGGFLESIVGVGEEGTEDLGLVLLGFFKR